MYVLNKSEMQSRVLKPVRDLATSGL